jgi:GTP cyclohydrolase I
MLKQENLVRLLPDVAVHAQPQLAGTLDWVGMAAIQTPVVFDAGDGQAQRASARVGAFVNLKRSEQRGIHMSRLYLRVEQALAATPLNPDTLHALLTGFIESQAGLADCARVTISFEQLVRRTALRSQYSGWRAYPVLIEASLIAGVFTIALTTEVLYSSTCPASAALSRQLIQDQFAHDFPTAGALDHATVLAWLGSERGIVATPQAQRSVAQVQVTPVVGGGLPLLRVLDAVEHALGTPVQTAVKREDEQEFALANGGNLMFCEDAARRIHQALDSDDGLADFHVRVEHQESLHPHDAVAYASKDIVHAK